MKFKAICRFATLSLLGAFLQLLPGYVTAQTILYVSDDSGISTIPQGSANAVNFINLPSGGTQDLAFDLNGNLFASNNQNIYEIGPGGVVSMFATGLSSPGGLAFDATGNLFVANNGANSILKITPEGGVSTFASGLNNPSYLAFDSSGNLFVSNNVGAIGGNGTISRITSGGVVSTFAIGLFGPTGLAFDTDGNLFVNEGGAIAKVTTNGSVSIFANTSVQSIAGLVIDSNGNILFTDSDGIWTATPQGNVSLYAGVDGQGKAFGPASFSAGIPEPATWAWLTGGLALALAAWRKSRR